MFIFSFPAEECNRKEIGHTSNPQLDGWQTWINYSGVFQLKIQPIYATSASIIRKKINLIHLQQNLLRVSHLTINIEYTFSFKPVDYLCSSLPTGGCSLFWPSYTFCYLLPSLSFLRDRSYRTLKHITFILKRTFFSKTLTLF